MTTARLDDTTAPRVLVVQNSQGSKPGRLPDLLRAAGLDVDVIAADHLPANLDGVDGLVLLGGGFLPDDDEVHPFLVRERALVSEAIADELPVLGICLGAQVLAHTAGGVVTAHSGETEKGSCGVELLAAATDDALFGGVACEHPELRMVQSHRDSITTLPPCAVHLATSPRCRVQAFRVGPAAWGVQFHPEAPMTRVAEWDVAGLAALGFDRDEIIERAAADDAVNAEQAAALIYAFAKIVASVPQ